MESGAASRRAGAWRDSRHPPERSRRSGVRRGVWTDQPRTRSLAVWAFGGALASAGCGGDAAEGPATVPHPGAAPPRVVAEGPAPLVEHTAPRDSLLVCERGEGTLIFYRGRGVARDAQGLAYLPDGGASRVLVVDGAGKVRRTVGGPSPASGGLGLPLSVAVTPRGELYVADMEHPRGLLFFDAKGSYVGAATPPVPNPNLAAAPDGGLWAARSPYVLGFEPTEPEAPLLYKFDPLEGTGLGIDAVAPLGSPLADRLANAGALAVDADGTAFLSFLLRNELRAYEPGGTLRWRVRRALPFPTDLPTVERAEGSLRLRARPVTQALTVGPDGLLYALTAADPPGGAEGAADAPIPAATADEIPADGKSMERGPPGIRRIEVYEPSTGDLLRASTIPAGWTTLAVDGAGRVHRADAEAILASAPPPERRQLPELALESFEGDSVPLSRYRGRALLLNFWASWCEPCKRELPQLKAYYEGLDSEARGRVEFLAISEDTDPAAARRFAEPLELPFPLFLGRGRMREHFRYLGLPHTIIVDGRGRIVEEIQGFGSEETWRHLTSTLEREIERARPTAAPTDPEPAGGEAELHPPGEGHPHHQHPAP